MILSEDRICLSCPFIIRRGNRRCARLGPPRGKVACRVIGAIQRAVRQVLQQSRAVIAAQLNCHDIVSEVDRCLVDLNINGRIVCQIFEQRFAVISADLNRGLAVCKDNYR